MTPSPSNPSFSYFPTAFFSAFTTLPGFQKSASFFLTDIRKIFDTYREGLAQMQEKANGPSADVSQEKDFLYCPVPYVLFGEFDMAIFSMIDDLSYATQHFKPPAHSKKGFKYQINSGIIPLVEAYKRGYKKLPKFQRKTLPDFFSNTAPELYPFTGIVALKLNNAMLVGTGHDFVKLINFYLVTFLDKKIDKLSKQGVKMFYILNENLGWNELAIYFFGNSLEVINQMVMDFRQLTLRRIKKNFKGLLKQKEYDGEQLRKVILPIINRIVKESLLSDFISNQSGTKLDILESHPFIATAATYGFSTELMKWYGNDDEMTAKCKFKKKQMSRFKKECGREGFISIRWKVKPGHEAEASKLIKECFPGFKGKLTESTHSGKYPFEFPKLPLSFDQYLAYAKRAAKIAENRKTLHIIKIRSTLHWSLPVPIHEFNIKKHYVYRFGKYKIKEDQIKAIQRKLFIYPIPFTFKNQIESLINNYNDAIDDPLMYNYFIGLKYSLFSFLKERFGRNLFAKDKKIPAPPRHDFTLLQKESYDDVIQTRKDVNTLTISSLDTNGITEFIQHWNKAYWNRYFHSYYFTEINDFNIEHHGGIQQILFSYDTIYRLISKRIYGKYSKNPFVDVQVGPTITSTEFYNTINFTHLFRPSIYACECVHEAANHIIPFMVKQRNCHQYKFIFDPNSNRMDADAWSNQLELEARLHAHVGPRDDYERKYLHNHFGLNAIRHIVTDFATYLLGYSDPSISDLSQLWKAKDMHSIRVFYHTHWFLFLVRTDLYYREDSGNGSWFFNDSDFQALFMRFNLMFHLFMELNRDQLDELNSLCPSIELKAMWESEKNRLLDLTERLGKALTYEFKEQAELEGITDLDEKDSIRRFRDTIILHVLDKGWKEMKNEKDQQAYQTAIRYNQRIIFAFHELFTEKQLGHNMIIRKSSVNIEPEVKPNIDFYTKIGKRDIFLDPKGNLFITSPSKRKEVLRTNIEYLNNIWDLSLKVSRRDY